LRASSTELLNLEVLTMRTCSVSKGLLAPLCVFSLAAAFTLLGCGSDLGSPPTDAAKDVPAAVDSANSNPSLDAAGAEVLPSDAAPIDAAAVPMDVAPIDVEPARVFLAGEPSLHHGW
jgi:hypothetical protein